MSSVHDLIETLYKDTIGIREAIKDAEVKLERDKERKDLEARCSRHIMNRFEIPKKPKLYKRQNSFKLDLEDIRTIEDLENCEEQLMHL